jgi:hypothetical protein
MLIELRLLRGGNDSVDVSSQQLFGFTFKSNEHDSVAELGMAGDDLSVKDDGLIVEPEFDLKRGADGEGHHHLDVTTAATEIGGFKAQGDAAALEMEFDLDVDAAARMAAAFVFNGGAWLNVEIIHYDPCGRDRHETRGV